MRVRQFLTQIAAMVAGASLVGCAPPAETGPVVLAAASMQEGLGAAADSWAGQGHARPVLSFASSAAVARQVSEGAPADMVVTSDDRWIDWLSDRGALAGDPRPLVTNALVVVAPVADGRRQSLATFAADPVAGRLAIGEPDSVPAGDFARAALRNMGLWDILASRLAPGENVRASLALVERGEASLGIVYASDAQSSERVRVVETIDEQMHPAIVYYAALAIGSRHEDARAFLDYLVSAEGRAVIAAQGFELP